ncbi:unnamed protein product [Trichogramma brassicae]|uniref:Uncharacterized protein n=1 Tax=Trichogramma brassicae TaxID=86971 RepID=A0A6H5I9X7_9HYME|nr:unnamed protein product [Trichogramma brassicae]
MLIRLIKLCIDATIRLYVLYEIFGFSFKLLGAMMSSVTSLLIHRDNKKNKTNEVKCSDDENTNTPEVSPSCNDDKSYTNAEDNESSVYHEATQSDNSDESVESYRYSELESENKSTNEDIENDGNSANLKLLESTKVNLNRCQEKNSGAKINSKTFVVRQSGSNSSDHKTKEPVTRETESEYTYENFYYLKTYKKNRYTLYSKKGLLDDIEGCDRLRHLRRWTTTHSQTLCLNSVITEPAVIHINHNSLLWAERASVELSRRERSAEFPLFLEEEVEAIKPVLREDFEAVYEKYEMEDFWKLLTFRELLDKIKEMGILPIENSYFTLLFENKLTPRFSSKATSRPSCNPSFDEEFSAACPKVLPSNNSMHLKLSLRCGCEEESLNHVLWNCGLLEPQREAMMERLKRMQLFPPFNAESLLAQPNIAACKIICGFFDSCRIRVIIATIPTPSASSARLCISPCDQSTPRYIPKTGDRGGILKEYTRKISATDTRNAVSRKTNISRKGRCLSTSSWLVDPGSDLKPSAPPPEEEAVSEPSPPLPLPPSTTYRNTQAPSYRSIAEIEKIMPYFDGKNMPVAQFIHDCKVAKRFLRPADHEFFIALLKARVKDGASCYLQHRIFTSDDEIYDELKRAYAPSRSLLPDLLGNLSLARQGTDEKVGDYGLWISRQLRAASRYTGESRATPRTGSPRECCYLCFSQFHERTP